MGEWRELKICEVGEVVGGGTPSTEVVEYWNGEIPWLTPRDLSNYTKRKIRRGERNISERGLQNSNVRILPKGTVLLSSRAPIGYLAIAENEISTNQGFQSIIPNQEATTEFLYYLLKANVEYLKSQGEGTTFGELSKRTLKELVFSFPGLREQLAIASILSSIDDKIDLLHRQNKTLEQLAETLFRQWFVEEADDGWEEKSLGEILTITSSKRIYYSEYVPYGVPFYRSKEIIELHNTGSTNGELFIPEERFIEIENRFGAPVEGDILMTSVGTLGVPYRVRKKDKFYFKDGNLTWFKDFKILPSSIIYLWLNSRIGQEQLSNITIGSTQEALTIEGLKSISLKIPALEKIKIYEIEFNSIVTKTEFNQDQIRTLTQLRDTLLPKLMSGEVRVKQ